MKRYFVRDYRDRVERKLDHIHEMVHRILERIDAIMPTLDEILAKQDEALAKATANTDALGAIKTILDANTATIADLQAQLAAAGNDPVKLQQVMDNMNKIVEQADNQAAAEAALSGTPAAPQP